MAVNQIRSSKAIIAKTMRDLRIQRTDWVDDAIEWIGEALDAIGTPGQLVDKARIMKTTGHKAKMPSDLYLIKGVYYGHGNKDKKIENLTLEDFPMFMEYGEQDLHPALIEESDTNKGADAHTNETFLVNGEYFQTSFENDYFVVFYKAFPLDEDGFPMLPDMYEFSQAVYWYIVMKLMEGGMPHPVNGFNYFHAEERWLKYCGQARAQANMPDISRMAHFRKMWVRLVPQWNRDFQNRDDDNISLNDLKSGTVETRPISS